MYMGHLTYVFLDFASLLSHRAVDGALYLSHTALSAAGRGIERLGRALSAPSADAAAFVANYLDGGGAATLDQLNTAGLDREALVYDAVASVGIASCAAERRYNNATATGRPAGSAARFAELMALDFDGASGPASVCAYIFVTHPKYRRENSLKISQPV